MNMFETRGLRRPLKELADIRGGYVGPNATTDRPGPEEWRALQGGDIQPDGSIAWGKLRYAQPIRDARRYAIRSGEVILPLRAVRPRATTLDEIPIAVIAVGQWAIITPVGDTLDPAYVAWYLNHPVTASRLTRLTQGTNLSFLSLAAIRDFEIDVPPRDVQAKITAVATLHARMTELEQELATTRQRYIDAITMEALYRAITSNYKD